MSRLDKIRLATLMLTNARIGFDAIFAKYLDALPSEGPSWVDVVAAFRVVEKCKAELQVAEVSP